MSKKVINRMSLMAEPGILVIGPYQSLSFNFKRNEANESFCPFVLDYDFLNVETKNACFGPEQYAELACATQ